MSIQRKLIRREVCRLLSGRTAAAGRILLSKSQPVQDAGLALGKPVLRIYTRSETWEIRNDAPRDYLRRLRLAVEGYVAESTAQADGKGAVIPADDVADDLAAQVECLLLARLGLPALRGKVAMDRAKTTCEGVETEDDYEGERPTGAFRLTFVYAYLTSFGEGTLAELDPLAKFGVDWDLAPPDGVLDAQDEIDVPTV